MTIEVAPKPPAPHKSSGTEAHTNSPKKQTGAQSANKAPNASTDADKSGGKAGAEGAGDAGANGFLAILSALGDGAAQGVTDTPGSAQALLAGEDMSWNDGQVPGGDASDSAALWAQAAVAAPPDTANDGASASGDTDAVKAALAAAMAGATGNRPANAGSPAQVATEQDGAARLIQRAHGNTGSSAKNHAIADQNFASSQADNAGSDMSANSAVGVTGAKADSPPSFDLKLFTAMQEARGTQSPKVPESAVLTSLIGTDKRAGEGAESTKYGADATYSATPVGVSASGYSVNSTSEASAAPDMQAAEQVKYWISQDVQNAELKLDGLGDKPVEVTISVNGNEAHVAFRTDEIQTRGVLESAGAHLKDMLAREGLLLSGVSVGTSGANDGGGGERKPRQGQKQGLVSAAVQVGAVDTGNRASGRPGRALDLFV